MNENMKALLEKLGEEIEKDEAVVAYRQARHDYNTDRELTNLISEYNVQAMLMQNETEKKEDERDEAVLNSVKERIDVLYKDIMGNPIMNAYSEAEKNVNALFAEINNALSQYVIGEEECSSCSGNCSCCGGCH